MTATATELKVDAPDIEARVAEIDADIEKAHAARRDLDLQYREGKDAISTSLARLQSARKALLREARASTRPARDRGPLDPHKQAGAKNIKRVREAAKKAGRATQAALAATSGVGTGSMTWAIRALEQDGVLKATGERENGSRVFVYVDGGKRSTRSRVLRPGEEG